MAKAFTDKYILSLKPTDKKYYKREGRGFTLRIMPSGIKTFLYIYTFEGKRKELNLGTYPQVKLTDAREKYQEAYTKKNNGTDPSLVEATPDLVTFKHFSNLYLEWSEKNHVAALYKINKYSLNNDVLPYWEDRDIISIRRRDAITLLENVSKRSPGQVSNVQRAARGVFQHAIDRDYIESNPMLRLQKVVPDLKYVPKDRVLTDNEIQTLWPILPASLKLILLTAQRPGEIAGMHSREVQAGVGKPLCTTCRSCGWLTIPKERALKGRGDHLVYLTKTAMDLIENTDGYFFPSPRPDKPIERLSLSRYVNRNKYFNLAKWTPHDLRRTARTHMAKIGIIEEHAEAVIGHCKKGVVNVYNKYDYQEEKKQALIKWEAELLKLVS